MKTIVWHMNHRGFFLNSANIDIKLFYEVLEEIVGNIGDVVLTDVYKNLKSHYPDDVDKILSKDPAPQASGTQKSASTIEKIERLLQVEIGERN